MFGSGRHRTLFSLALAALLLLVVSTSVGESQRRPDTASPDREPDLGQPRRPAPDRAPGQAGQEFGDAAARTDGAVRAIGSHETGERLFRQETFSGNGRTCAGCHVPADSFSITPERVRSLFREDRNGPLFQDRDSDDGARGTWTIVRRYALFSVELPLHESVAVEGNPSARSILVRRAVPALANVALTAPYGWDGGSSSLEDRSETCAREQLASGGSPDRKERQALALFQELLLYPARLSSWMPPRLVTQAPERTLPVPAAAARRGRTLFNDACAGCHGGELMHRQPGSDGSALYASVGISEMNTNGLDVHRLVFTREDGTTTTVATPDPGLAAITGRLQDVNRFEVPTLRGVAHSAPYFHDHAAADLDAVIEHYETLLGLGLDAGQREDLRAYLESL